MWPTETMESRTQSSVLRRRGRGVAVPGILRRRGLAASPCSCAGFLARAAAAGYNVLNATGDWRDVIADPSIDAVHITTPNVSHFPIARAAFCAT